jgi:hypothetical protein
VPLVGAVVISPSIAFAYRSRITGTMPAGAVLPILLLHTVVGAGRVAMFTAHRRGQARAGPDRRCRGTGRPVRHGDAPSRNVVISVPEIDGPLRAGPDQVPRSFRLGIPGHQVAHAIPYRTYIRTRCVIRPEFFGPSDVVFSTPRSAGCSTR